MDFDLTEDQREIKNVARELLAARSPFAKVREAAEAAEYDDALWREIVALGWPGIAVAEEYGGQGLGAVELAVLLEELGYACAATPFLATAVAAAVIQAGGTDEQRRRWLPGLISGELRAGLGAADLVVDGHGADVVVLLEDDGARLLAVGGGVVIEPLVAIDPTRRFATVRGEGEPLAADVADRARAAIAAEVVGVCQRALDMTLEYVKERKQFGVAVGSFQAVSHRCAQMLLHTESARSTAYYAAWAADAEPSRLGEAAALAGAAAATGAREVAASAIQAHGGIGFTWEADVHWLYKRGEVDRALLGGAKRHHAALARAAAQRLAVPAP
ncbi:MAG TPA: acyl-CoA dehydrogenase family protein [Solirubrobacteraceae bacterium]|jgi:alkylation response protein AidB-like acyl-CoA dehydrogenase|nr:acyl-CoA dehydrogenase family protein [Solirubrobacteraceae bacterium]